jgi:glutaredoxin
MAKTITVYTTATCPYCTMVKAWLKENKFPFKEKRVDEDRDAAQEMILKSGQMGVPFTVIANDEGEEEGVLGFDQPRLKQVLLA